MKTSKNRLAAWAAALALMVGAGQQAYSSDLDSIAALVQPKFYDSGRPADFLEFNAHAAVGVMSLVHNFGAAVPDLSDFLLSPGTMIDLGLTVRFNLRNSFGLATGLEFGINNLRYAMGLVGKGSGQISSIYVRNHFYDLTVPVYVSWWFNMGRLMKWSVDGGLYFAKGFGGYSNYSGYTSGVNSLGQPVVTQAQYSQPYFDATVPFIAKLKSFDWGPRIATGLVYRGKYTFKFIFQLSAQDLVKNQAVLDLSYRHASIGFELGYIF